MDYMLLPLRRYAEFQGRSRRKEYWLWALFVVLAVVILTVVDGALGTLDAASGFGLLTGIFYLGVLIPGLAVGVRRLHDTGRSGWWLLVGLIPLIGAIVLLVFTVSDGDRGANRFGPSPKAT